MRSGAGGLPFFGLFTRLQYSSDTRCICAERLELSLLEQQFFHYGSFYLIFQEY